MTYNTGNGLWFQVQNGQIASGPWNGCGYADQSTAAANNWFPGYIPVPAPAYDARYYSLPTTYAATGDVVTVTYGSLASNDIATVKAAKLQDLSAQRYSVQNAGTTVNGILVKTDPESLTLIAGAKSYVDAAAAAGNTGVTVSFKSGSTFTALNQSQVDAISFAVAQHVQGCFSNEAAHAALINALTDPAAVIAYNISTGWPA